MNMIDCYITAVPNAIGTLAYLDTMITTIEAPHLRASVLHMMIVHTCPERTLVASQADTDAILPDATHPRRLGSNAPARHCSQSHDGIHSPYPGSAVVSSYSPSIIRQGRPQLHFAVDVLTTASEAARCYMHSPMDHDAATPVHIPRKVCHFLPSRPSS